MFIAAFYRQSQGWTELSKDMKCDAIFLPKFRSVAWFSPPMQMRIVHLSPFLVGLEKFSSAVCCCSFNYGTA